MDVRTEYLLTKTNLIIAIGFSFGIPESEIADFVQETLVRSLASCCRFDSAKGSITTYSANFVRMSAKSWLRARRASLPLSEQDAPASDDFPDLEILWNQFEQIISENGYTLTPRQKQIIYLLKMGHKKAAIARALAISKQAISKHAKYIRKKYEGTILPPGRKKK